MQRIQKNQSIRKARRGDIPEMMQLVNHHIRHTTANYDYVPRTQSDQENYFMQKEQSRMPMIVAEIEGRFSGFATYDLFRPWEGYRFSVEHSIYVVNKQQNRGIGKALMHELITLAKDAGYHTMIAGVDAANERSLRFHEKQGFEQVAHFKEVAFKFDRWHDLVFLQLLLKPTA